MATFTASLWFHRRDRVYGWFTLSTLAWAALHVAFLSVELPIAPTSKIGLFLLLVFWAVLQARFLLVFRAYADPSARALPVVLGAAAAAGLAHDAVAIAEESFVRGALLLPWAASLTLVVTGGILLRRFVLAMRESEAAVATLELRVRQKREELEKAHQRLHEAEHTRVLSEERERIMREMHDGLGSHLVSTLSLIECGARQDEIAGALRSTLEDLRVMIDALVPVDGDLVAALAMLRSRLQPRLEAAGIAVEWNVGELPPLPAFGPHSVMQVLRIVQEALANVVKHAGASSVAIRSGTDRGTIVVEVADDGCGVSLGGAAASGGRGIAFMRRRARDLGGAIEVLGSSRGTTVRLSIPAGGASCDAERAA